MIGVIIVGILICVSIIWTAFEFRNNSCDFNIGVPMGIAIGTLMTIEVCLLADIIGESKPSALDVYRGNTELEITSVNGVPTDTVVVFKKIDYERQRDNKHLRREQPSYTRCERGRAAHLYRGRRDSNN